MIHADSKTHSLCNTVTVCVEVMKTVSISRAPINSLIQSPSRVAFIHPCSKDQASQTHETVSVTGNMANQSIFLNQSESS